MIGIVCDNVFLENLSIPVSWFLIANTKLVSRSLEPLTIIRLLNLFQKIRQASEVDS